MVTRTKKIFVGGLSANTVVEDVKQYFEQFGKVSGAWGWLPCPPPPLCRSCVLKNLVLELGCQDLSEICQELTWRSPACGRHGAPRACRNRQTEQPFSGVLLPFGDHVGPGLGAGGGSGWGGMRGCDSQDRSSHGSC
ncbi:rna-binding protein musashi homolog 2 isoform b [Lynx pardinus]|uniref:Rna-binding protein musashi homolog 2 isoform b n=1 Tax=Lynx pardinus TaxID=191816 RepID=A0A485P2T6_LYNPA|nr:rna-binding protein musashi homolog 2 isoform b [Lynx pardinus]